MSKYNRTYHLPWSPGTTSDDRISPSVSSLIGKEIVITEKLDGENCGMTDDGVYARSHATFTTSPWSREVRQLHKLSVEDELGDGVYLFGENMEGIHSIEYTNLTSYFYIFGIRDNNIWISWDKVEEYSYLLDIPTVPVLFRGVVSSEKELKDLVEKLVKEPSALGGSREGIVVRNADMFHNDDFAENVMKWVRKGHVSFVEVQEFGKPNKLDKYFSKKPNAMNAEQQLSLQVKQGKGSNSLAALEGIMGLMKDDISDEQFKEILKDTHR